MAPPLSHWPRKQLPNVSIANPSSSILWMSCSRGDRVWQFEMAAIADALRWAFCPAFCPAINSPASPASLALDPPWKAAAAVSAAGAAGSAAAMGAAMGAAAGALAAAAAGAAADGAVLKKLWICQPKYGTGTSEERHGVM